MDYIKYIDTFGIKFHFYTNNQPNHQNIFGGIMTFIYILICIGIFYIFSYDEIYQLNPISSISVITDIKPKNINIKNEKIRLPFRIITDENKYIDHRGIFYISPYLVKGINNSNLGMELKSHLLNYKLCNETSMVNKPDNYKIDVPLNELFCIEQDDIPFGGNWNGNFINYIEISLYLCENGVYFNRSDPKCSNIINLFKNTNSSISFDFYYPVVQFQPTNLETPLSIVYKNYFYRLSAYSQKLEKLYIQQHILSDDRNLINYNYKNISCWGTSSLSGDDYFLSSLYDPFIKNKNSNPIFTMEIYMDYGLIYYTRTYNKIFLIISNVFPLFRFVLYFIKKFTQHIKISLTKRELVGLIFENKNISRVSLVKLNNINKMPNKNIKIKIKPKIDDSHHELIKNNNNINNLLNNKFNIDNDNNNKKNESLKNNSNSINEDKKSEQKSKNKSNSSSLNIENSIKVLDKKEIPVHNSKNKIFKLIDSIDIKDSSNNQIKLYQSKKKKYLFSYYYFFLDIIFDKLIFPKKFFCLSKTYFTVYNFMCQIYDISTHIILFKQFNAFNNILKKIYEEKGFCPAHPFNKINIKDYDAIERINKDLKNKKSILFSKNFYD